jgi:hypothetical protein
VNAIFSRDRTPRCVPLVDDDFFLRAFDVTGPPNAFGGLSASERR